MIDSLTDSEKVERDRIWKSYTNRWKSWNDPYL